MYFRRLVVKRETSFYIFLYCLNFLFFSFFLPCTCLIFKETPLLGDIQYTHSKKFVKFKIV